MATEKSRETRLRRMAGRQGLRLIKTRRRDPLALDYGTYMLIDPVTSGAVAGLGAHGYPHFSIDDVEKYLTSDRETR